MLRCNELLMDYCYEEDEKIDSKLNAIGCEGSNINHLRFTFLRKNISLGINSVFSAFLYLSS